MSLRHAVLGLLAERPMTGFDLVREFDIARSVIWPAPQNEVYRLLAKLRGEGLIVETASGARGSRTYAATDSGRAELSAWLAAPSDYTLRYEPMLKAVFLGSAGADATCARARDDLTFFQAQIDAIEKAERARASAGDDPRREARRMALGFYRAMAAWAAAVLAEHS